MTAVQFPPIFAQQILDRCPVGIVVTDNRGTITWVNETLSQWLGATPEALAGLRADPVAAPEVTSLLSEHDRTVVRGADGRPRELIHRRFATEGSNTEEPAVVHYYLDDAVDLRAENERLRHEVEQLSLRDERTGVLNERALMLVLEPQVSRSRRYQNPLTLVTLAVQWAPAPDADHPPELGVSRILKDQLRWADVIGRDEGGRFVLILPETEQDAAAAMINKLSRQLERESHVSDFHFGVAEWSRTDSATTLMRRAREALAQARGEGTGRRLNA